MVDPVTKLPNGYTTAVRGTFEGDTFVLPGVAAHPHWFDDFLFLNAAVYTQENSGDVGSSAALLDAITEPSGVCRLTSVNGAGIAEMSIQLASIPFQFADGKKLWFETRVRVQDLAATTIEVGLQTIGANIAARNGVTLAKTISGNADELRVIFNDAGINPFVTAGRFVVNTWTKLQLYWDGVTLHVYQDDVFVQSFPNTTTDFLRNTNIGPVFALQRSGVTTRTADVDYFNVIAER